MLSSHLSGYVVTGLTNLIWVNRAATMKQPSEARATMRKRLNLVGQIPLITLIVLCVVTALLTPRFLSPLNLTNILVQSSIMAVIPIGLTFLLIRRRCHPLI